MINNVSFTGKTNLCVSPNAYRDIENITRRAYTNLYRNNNCRLFNGRICALHTDSDYITVIAKSDDDGFFKYIPINKECKELLDDITIEIEKLKDKAKKNTVTAWIVGGTKLDGKHGSEVTTTLNRIAEHICDRKDIDTSILVGSETGEEVFVIRPGIRQLKLALDKKVNPKNNLEQELGSVFDIVELNNTHLSYMA